MGTNNCFGGKIAAFVRKKIHFLLINFFFAEKKCFSVSQLVLPMLAVVLKNKAHSYMTHFLNLIPSVTHFCNTTSQQSVY